MLRKFSNDEELQFDQPIRIEAKRGLFCSSCLGLITDVSNSLQIGGAHQHTCTNPARVTFTIGCFKDAPGCRQFGVPTSEFTWFPGYCWRLALCDACGKHLGWSFQGPADHFYGLIVSELVEK